MRHLIWRLRRFHRRMRYSHPSWWPLTRVPEGQPRRVGRFYVWDETTRRFHTWDETPEIRAAASEREVLVWDEGQAS